MPALAPARESSPSVITAEAARSRLLLPELAGARSAVPAACPLGIPGRPACRALHRVRDLESDTDIWERTTVLAHTSTGPRESYMMIDKQNPHAQFEIMLMSAGRGITPGLAQHSARFTGAVAAAGSAFAGFCHGNGLYPVLSWSYDPATMDRESIQGEKRFHAHFTGRTPAERELVQELARPLGEHPAGTQRRLLDEATVLGTLLAWDRRERLSCLEQARPLSSPQATASILFRIPGGWEQLGAALGDLEAVHGMLDLIYRDVMSAWMTGRAGEWERPERRPAAAWQPFAGHAARALDHYMTGLRPAAPAAAPGGPREWITHTYPLAGLAYSVIISEHAGALWCHVRPVVFSDLGGAGATVIDGTLAKIKKGCDTFTAAEMASRASFQREFLAGLRQSAHGGAACWPLLEAS